MKVCPNCKQELEPGLSFCPACGYEYGGGSHEEGDPYAGRVFGSGYRLEAPIGKGAMGLVYRATQLSLGKVVAVKLLHRRFLGDPEIEARFEREARAASLLSHPNIIQIIDYGVAEDRTLYIVMEYVEGADLGSILRDEFPLAWPRVCSLLGQVASALYEAHQVGIIHRDLKPENILVTRTRAGNEMVKVLDFGIAKLLDKSLAGGGRAPVTMAGAVCGTPEYMAPEQARGAKVGPQADIYSLGVILYQMLCGELPFKAPTTLAVITKQLNEPPVPPRERRPELAIPEQLEALCLEAMAKDPSERPESGLAFRERLMAAHAAMSSQGVASSPIQVGVPGPTGPSPSAPSAAGPAPDEFLPEAGLWSRWWRPMGWGLAVAGIVGAIVGGYLSLARPDAGGGGGGSTDAGHPRLPSGAEPPRAQANSMADAGALAMGSTMDGGVRDLGDSGMEQDDSSHASRGRKKKPRRIRRAGRGRRRPKPRRRTKPRQPAKPPAPDAGRGLYSEARRFFKMGKTAQAIRAYEAALAKGYRNPDVYFELGRCYARVRDNAKAARYYRLYLEHGRDPAKLSIARAIVGR